MKEMDLGIHRLCSLLILLNTILSSRLSTAFIFDNRWKDSVQSNQANVKNHQESVQNTNYPSLKPFSHSWTQQVETYVNDLIHRNVALRGRKPMRAVTRFPVYGDQGALDLNEDYMESSSVSATKSNSDSHHKRGLSHIPSNKETLHLRHTSSMSDYSAHSKTEPSSRSQQQTDTQFTGASTEVNPTPAAKHNQTKVTSERVPIPSSRRDVEVQLSSGNYLTTDVRSERGKQGKSSVVSSASSSSSKRELLKGVNSVVGHSPKRSESQDRSPQLVHPQISYDLGQLIQAFNTARVFLNSGDDIVEASSQNEDDDGEENDDPRQSVDSTPRNARSAQNVYSLSSDDAPTPRPRPKPLAPTAAPSRKLSENALDASVASTKHPVPTPEATEGTKAHSSSGVEGLMAKSPAHNDSGISAIKRTTSMPSGYRAVSNDGLSFLQIASGSSQGVSPGQMACLQYRSVQHNLPCVQRSRRSAAGGVGKAPSDLQHLSLLLQHYGGSSLSPFTATSDQEAAAKFRNLMPLGIPDTDKHVHVNFTAHQIQRLLEQHYAIKNRLHQSDVSQPQYEQNRGNGRSYKQGPKTSDVVEHDENITHQNLPVEFLQHMMPAKYVTFSETAQRRKRAFNEEDRHSYACTYSVSCRNYDSSVCAGGETEMALDDNGCDTCRCKVRDAMNGYCLHLSHDTSVDASQRAHLCTQCQQTRFLGRDVFPGYVQEVVCHPDNAPCLDIGRHGPQGQCQETHIPISVLRRNTGRCMRVELTTGQFLLLDDWTLSQQMIRTGCQCMIDKRSPLMPSLGRH